MVDLMELMNSTPNNLTIYDAVAKCYSEVKNHESIVASVSGGSDSDIMLDMIVRCGGKDKTDFVFFNTGLEYDATKKQIDALNDKYGINITVVQPVKPIPTCVKEYGVPFLSKQVSEYISRLQRHNFKWEDRPFDELYAEYPKCKVALRWWCNEWGEGSKFNISYNTWLKEFMLENPPTFKISNQCCYWAKKLPVKRYKDANNFDMNCMGVRKAEGGARSSAYKNCFTATSFGMDEFRPLFWLNNQDKVEYEKHYGITHSDCYEVWGMKRTGCAGCPFGKNFDEELELARVYEPKFYKAMIKIFGQSYEYTRQYRAFQQSMKCEKN